MKQGMIGEKLSVPTAGVEVSTRKVYMGSTEKYAFFHRKEKIHSLFEQLAINIVSEMNGRFL